MSDEHSPEEFRSQVRRLVTEGKLSPEDAEGLLEGLEAPAAPVSLSKEASASAPSGEAIPPDLRLDLSACTFQVVHDPALSRPTLHVSEEGALRLEATDQGWRVSRVNGPDGHGGFRFGWNSVTGLLSVPFVPRHVQAEMNGGRLSLGDLEGELRLELSGGTASVGHAAALHAEINGGSLSAGEVGGSTHLEVNGGTIRVERAPSLEAEVNGGALHWAGVLAGGKHRVEVNGGSATLHLRAGSSVRLEGEVTVGQVNSDFPMQKHGNFMESRLSGQIGDGAAHLGFEVAAGQLRLVTR